MKSTIRNLISIIFFISIIQKIENKVPEPKSFTDLQEAIDNLVGHELNLTTDYVFDPKTDKTSGIIIKKALTINGEDHIIDGLNQAKIFEIQNSNVFMKYIRFNNGFSQDFGGSINAVNSSLKLLTCFFKYSNAKIKGGAVNIKNTTLNITDCDFKYNHAESLYVCGGGLASESSKIYVDITKFIDNSADEGGAIYSINTTLDIYNSLIYDNNANWYGGAIVSDSHLFINNSRIYNNKAGYKGGAIHTTYSHFTDDGFVKINYSAIYNNSAEYGGVISTSNIKYVHINKSNIYENHASYGAVFSRMSTNEIQINRSTCHHNTAIYGSVLYSATAGNNSFIVADFNNNKADVGGDIYTINSRYSNNNYKSIFNKFNIADKKFVNNNLRSDGCSSTVIQIEDHDSAFTFRRDSKTPVNVIIAYQKDGILQYKSDHTFFWHTYISNDGWIIGNGGLEYPHLCEKLEAYSRIMIKNKAIIDEFIKDVVNIKSMENIGHYFIKSPNGTYALISHQQSKNTVIIEKKKLKSGEYIISPNLYEFYKKGKISDLNIKGNYTYISRYLAAIDEYSSERTNEFTYNYIGKDKLKYVDIFVSNDDGSLSNKPNTSNYINDIYINDKYILGESVPIIMEGMYLDRYTIPNINSKINISIRLLLLFILLLIG